MRDLKIIKKDKLTKLKKKKVKIAKDYKKENSNIKRKINKAEKMDQREAKEN